MALNSTKTLRIPTYKSRTKMNTRNTAGLITRKADASAFAAPGLAQAEIGDSISSLAKQYGQYEKKILHNTQLNAAKSAYNSKLIEIQNEIELDPKLNANPDLATSEFNRRARLARESITSTGSIKIGNQVVKDLTFSLRQSRNAFADASSTAATTAGSSVRKLARSRMIDQSIGATLELADKLSQEIHSGAFSGPDLQRKKDELYGRTVIDTQTGAVIRTSSGIFDQLQNMGHLTGKQVQAYEKSYRVKGARADVTNAMRKAAQGDPVTAAQALGDFAIQIQDTNNFPDLPALDRATYATTVERLRTSLEAKAMAAETKKINDGIKQQNLTYTKTFRKFFTQIRQSRAGTQDANGQLIKPPTVADFIEAENADELKPGDAEKLTQMLTSLDPPQPNPRVLLDARKRVRNATDQTAINNEIDNMRAEVGVTISPGEFEAFENYAASAIAKTPEYRKRRRYEKLFDKLFAAEGPLDRIIGGVQQQSAILRAEFDAMVDDKVPIDDAFREIYRSFLDNKKIQLEALVPPKFGPVIGADPLGDPGMTKPLKEWTAEDVIETRKITMQKYSGRASGLAIEIFKLDALMEYLEAQGELDAAEVEAIQNQKSELQRRNN